MKLFYVSLTFRLHVSLKANYNFSVKPKIMLKGFLCSLQFHFMPNYVL